MTWCDLVLVQDTILYAADIFSILFKLLAEFCYRYMKVLSRNPRGDVGTRIEEILLLCVYGSRDTRHIA